MAQDIENKVKTETPDGAASKKAAPATSTTLNDDTKVSVKSLAPVQRLLRVLLGWKSVMFRR